MHYPCCGPWNPSWWSGIPSHERCDGSLVGRKGLQQCMTRPIVLGQMQNIWHAKRQKWTKLIIALCVTVKHEPHVFLFNLLSPRSLAIPMKQHSVFGWWPLWQEVLLQVSKSGSVESTSEFWHLRVWEKVQILSLGLRLYLWSGTQNYGKFL